jgi:N-acyl-D-aspartate/D-glutamate deacylase
MRPTVPCRAYVMGERGARNEAPTETDIARMSRIVEEGLRAGALGFSTSRTILHRSIDGELVPGTVHHEGRADRHRAGHPVACSSMAFSTGVGLQGDA